LSWHDFSLPIRNFVGKKAKPYLDHPFALTRFARFQIGCFRDHYFTPAFNPTKRSASFGARRASQSSITRTMSVNDQSFVVTPAAIAGVIRRL
jgi:hypothetical protein